MVSSTLRTYRSWNRLLEHNIFFYRQSGCHCWVRTCLRVSADTLKTPRCMSGDSHLTCIWAAKCIRRSAASIFHVSRAPTKRSAAGQASLGTKQLVPWSMQSEAKLLPWKEERHCETEKRQTNVPWSLHVPYWNHTCRDAITRTEEESNTSTENSNRDACQVLSADTDQRARSSVEILFPRSILWQQRYTRPAEDS